MPTKWPHDDTASKRAFYGDFRNKEWAAINLVRVYAPFKIYYDKKPVNGVLVHNKCAAAFQAAFTEIWEKCGHDQKAVDKAGASAIGVTGDTAASGAGGAGAASSISGAFVTYGGGGGGGGSYNTAFGAVGGNGGSGIVIVSYPQ